MQATGCQLLQEKVVGDSVKEFAEVLSLSFILQVGHPVIGYQVSQAAAASDKPRTAGLASLVSLHVPWDGTQYPLLQDLLSH